MRPAVGQTQVALSRGHLFAGLIGIGFLNAMFERLRSAATESGLLPTVLDGLGISALVWIAIATSIGMLAKDGAHRSATAGDLGVAVIVAAAFLVPHSALSWLALSGLGLHLMRTAPGSSLSARAGAIVLATTVPMFWARLVMSVFSDVVLEADAILVAMLAGTGRSANVVPFADGSGALWIAPECSSVANVSLAMLCAVLVVKARGSAWTLRNLTFGALACLAVMAINVARIGLVAVHPAQYDLIHGAAGASLAAWLSAAVVVGLCLLGVAGMVQRRLSLLLLGLLVLSLAGKVLGTPAPGLAPAGVFPDKLAADLAARGFEQDRVADGAFWASAHAGSCRIEIAEVAPQGWHRSMVRQYAAGRPLIFVFGGTAYAEQPVLWTKLAYYRQRLLAPFRLSVEAPVHAVVLTGCAPAEVPDSQTIAVMIE